MDVKEILKYNITGLTGDTSSAKSNTLYYLIEEVLKLKSVKVVTFGLKAQIEGVTQIYSIEELERVKNSLIIIDEFNMLFDLENRKNRTKIEQILQFIEHNNNKLVLCGLPEHFKKFISSKIKTFLFKGLNFANLINGSEMKSKVMSFKDTMGIKGSTILNLAKGQLLVISDSTHLIEVPYLEKYDTKKNNERFW